MASGCLREMTLIAFMSQMLSVICFNIDLDTRTVHSVNSDEWFGFSVALHMHDDMGWLIIGAPNAKTSQPGVTRGGAVYRCSPDIPNACQVIPFDISGNKFIRVRGQKVATDNKTEQWFGATIASSGKDGTIVACAPRYVHHSQNLRRREPVGTCYVSRSNFSGFREYAPCRTKRWGYHRQGSCQAGISAAVSKDGGRLFIGAVGSWYWQGQVFSQNLLDKSDQKATVEDSTLLDTSYLGFSSAVGEFTGDNQQDVIVGRPRGENLSGQILIFNTTLYSIFNISGEQIGSYFGYSVTAVDVNGDGLDDVIVGAPLYNDNSTKDGSYDTGRVYIFYQTRRHRFKSWDFIDGVTSKGRFGLALASLGDLNKDRCGDLGVGAPYAGKNGRGSIYIFLGGRHGINTKPSQIINAEDISSTISTFGFSLSGGLDMDGNKYPDLLVGGYNSDSAVFFRARPVVTLLTNFNQPQSIQLDSKGCSLEDETIVSCVLFNVCFNYHGVGLKNQLDIEYELALDSEMENNRRLYFLSYEGQSALTEKVELRKEELYCKTYYLYVMKDIEDKLTPITISATPKLIKKRSRSNLPFPVFNATIPKLKSVKIYIQNECGPDQVCIPDVIMNVSLNQQRYVIGQREKLSLNFSLSNEGEDAYSTKFFLYMSDHVDFVKVEPVNAKEYRVNCDGPLPGKPNILVCRVGNPFPANQSVQFNVLAAAKLFIAGASTFTFVAKVNSTNPELESTITDNEYELEIPVHVDSALVSYGLSNPWTISYNSTHYEEIEERQSVSDIGPEIIHTYAISNPGPSPIVKVNVTILWPIETLSGSPLLYLATQPFVFGNGSCSSVPYVNDMNVKVDSAALRRKILKILVSRTEYFEQDTNKNYTNKKEIGYIRRNRRAFANSFTQGAVSCGGALCIQINCTVHNLDRDTSFISIPGRLWASTVRELQLNKLTVTSKMIAKISQLPYGADVNYYQPEINTITTEVDARDIEIERSEIPWWIILIAVCVGLLILIGIMFALWRSGFFQRKRPKDLMNAPNHVTYGYHGYETYHSTRGDEAFL